MLFINPSPCHSDFRIPDDAVGEVENLDDITWYRPHIYTDTADSQPLDLDCDIFWKEDFNFQTLSDNPLFQRFGDESLDFHTYTNLTEPFSLVPPEYDAELFDESSSTCAASTPSSSKPSSPDTSPSSIACVWPSCGKLFTSRSEYNHHCRSHTKAFVCEEASCNARFATKTHLERHRNVSHTTTTKYYCKAKGCSRRRAGGQHFSRMDNCRRHAKAKHKLGAEAIEVVATDHHGTRNVAVED